MRLTEVEIEELDALLDQREKHASVWRLNRWMCVLCGFGVIAISVLMAGMQVLTLHRFHETDTTSAEPFTRSDVMLVGWDILILNSLMTCGLVLGACGIIMVFVGSRNWHKAKHEFLLIKLARSWLHHERSQERSDE
jgi:hypothetical protein